MSCGRVYTWRPDCAEAVGGHVALEVRPLPRLGPQEDGVARLMGHFVEVRNGAELPEPASPDGELRARPIGNANPNAAGDFLFDPGRGGGRMDTRVFVKPHWRQRYIDASHFGETNAYYHLDRMASYVDGLLREIDAPSLPRVIAVVNAHHAATEHAGVRDGIRRGARWLAFQGGHYRLPARRYDVPEPATLSPDGEIHLGPGRQLLGAGAIVRATGQQYRANASHNAGILYHEYGHHVTRHTADLRANALRRPDRQDNRKTALDEGTCDYWAATMLGVPHIWAWHQPHDERQIHPRSLATAWTMADYDPAPRADPHGNGTIWGAALWDLRTRVAASEAQRAQICDRLVLAMLLELGRRHDVESTPTVAGTRRARAGFEVGLAALLAADARIFAGQHRALILQVFAARGVAER